MAATRPIEVERGTFNGFVHSHNGYYAGDFSRRVSGGSHGQSVNGSMPPPRDEYLRSR